jgi:hypothetical protein
LKEKPSAAEAATGASAAAANVTRLATRKNWLIALLSFGDVVQSFKVGTACSCELLQLLCHGRLAVSAPFWRKLVPFVTEHAPTRLK